MALIQCAECQKEISDKARNCPHCGFPMHRYLPAGDRAKLWGYVFICLGMLLVTLEIFHILRVRGGMLFFGLGWLMFGISLIVQGKEKDHPYKPAAYTIVVISAVTIILSIIGLIFDYIL